MPPQPVEGRTDRRGWRENRGWAPARGPTACTHLVSACLRCARGRTAEAGARTEAGPRLGRRRGDGSENMQRPATGWRCVNPVASEAGATPACVPSMANSLEVQVLYPARWRRRISEAQGRRREAGSEGSVEQSRDPMDKNRIRGLPGRTSEQAIAKSAAIKGRGGKSGGCAVKAVGLTSGGLRRVRNPRTERFRKGRDRGAEVSRGHSSRPPGEGPNDGQGY